MSGPVDENNIHRYLTAFADGELGAARSLEVVRYLARHPEALEMIDQHQRLRIAARRAIVEGTPGPSGALRDRLRELTTPPTREAETSKAITPEADASEARTPAALTNAGSIGLPGVGSWARLGLAAAVALGVGGAVGHYLSTPRNPGGGSGPRIVETAVPASLVTAVTQVHVDCSRMAAAHTAAFPPQFGSLAASVRADLGGASPAVEPYPDLSPLGYQFVGAGPCAKPLEGIVHLLYRSTGAKVSDTLSVFVQTHDGRLPIDAGKAYAAAGADSPHPMFVWRSEKVVYYLVGDDMDTVAKARDAIAGPVLPTPAIRG